MENRAARPLCNAVHKSGRTAAPVLLSLEIIIKQYCSLAVWLTGLLDFGFKHF